MTLEEKIASLTPELKAQVATALVNKGISLGEQKDPRGEIAAYDEVIRRFGDRDEVPLLEWVANALFNKCATLGTSGKLQAARAARFGDLWAEFFQESQCARRVTLRQRDFGPQQEKTFARVGVEPAARYALQRLAGALQVAFLAPGLGRAQAQCVALAAVPVRRFEEAFGGAGEFARGKVALCGLRGIGRGAGRCGVAAGQRQGAGEQQRGEAREDSRHGGVDERKAKME